MNAPPTIAAKTTQQPITNQWTSAGSNGTSQMAATPQALTQRQIQQAANNSPQVKQLKAVQDMAQLKCDACEKDEETTQQKAAAPPVQTMAQLKCDACEKEDEEKQLKQRKVVQRFTPPLQMKAYSSNVLPIQMKTCAASNHNPGDPDHKRVQQALVADYNWEMERKVNDGANCAGGTDRYVDLINGNLTRVYEVKTKGNEQTAKDEADDYVDWVKDCCNKQGVQRGGQRFTKEKDMGVFGKLCYKGWGDGAITYYNEPRGMGAVDNSGVVCDWS